MTVLRQTLVVGIVAVMLLFGSASFASPALAQGPTTGAVRIHRTTDWFAQRGQSASGAGRNLNYYGGQVMLTAKNYLIYWIPPGYSVAQGYQNLLGRYFNDIGSTSFYNIVTQYYENPGTQHILNSSTLGGTWTDTLAYPNGRGTASNPLTDADIQTEVQRAVSHNSWTASTSNMYFVYTAQGVESCIDATTCTPGTAYPAYCAYHGYFVSGSKQYIYANMPYDETWTTQCRSFSTSPNGNIAADSEISVTSHEQFEAVTDLNPPPTTPNPGVTAWTDSAGYEIGDKCAYNYGRVNRNGSNVTLSGNNYIVQLEWSNAAHGCAKSY